MISEEDLRQFASITVQFHLIVKDAPGIVSSSGAIITALGQKYVVTVLHGIEDGVGILCMELKSWRPALVKPCMCPVILSRKLESDGLRGDPFVDFTFFQLPDGYMPIRRIETQNFFIREIPVLPIRTLDNALRYSLGGAIPCGVSGLDSTSVFKVISGLSYIATDSEPYVYFSTANSSIEPGISYEGLSGAPIVNENGVPVALLCGPCDEDQDGKKVPRRLWGVSLTKAIEFIKSERLKTMTNCMDLPEEERLQLAQRALELGSYFYDNDYEVKNMLWK